MGLAGLSWSSVEIPRVPPKPLLMPLTAGYRRTPVLQVGADIYCDTQNIIRCLAEQGTSEALFPDQCQGRALLLSQWIDQTLFPLAVRIVITEALDAAPAEFVKDRGDLYFGRGWTPEQLKKDLPGVVMQLNASLSELNASMAPNARAMGGERPSYADAAIAYLLWFIRGRWDQGPALLAQYPELCRIEDAMEAIGQGQYTELEAAEALAIAKAVQPLSPQGICMDSSLAMGQRIGVRPFLDSSDPMVVGSLRYLDATRVSIDVEDDQVGLLAIHFPISGYQVVVV